LESVDLLLQDDSAEDAMSVDSNVHSGFDDEDSDGFHPHRPRRRFTMQEYDRALESGAIRDTSYKSQDPIEQRPPLVRKTGIRVAQISDEAYTSEEDLSDEVPDSEVPDSPGWEHQSQFSTRAKKGILNAADLLRPQHTTSKRKQQSAQNIPKITGTSANPPHNYDGYAPSMLLSAKFAPNGSNSFVSHNAPPSPPPQFAPNGSNSFISHALPPSPPGHESAP
jgi:hypothetical protein